MNYFKIIALLSFLLISYCPTHAQSRQTEGVPSFKWLRAVKGQSLRPYSEGYAAFYEAGKWGYEDLKGEITIPAQFEEAGDFKNGFAIVKKTVSGESSTLPADRSSNAYTTASPLSRTRPHWLPSEMLTTTCTPTARAAFFPRT